MHMTIPLKELQAALKAVAPATKGTPGHGRTQEDGEQTRQAGAGRRGAQATGHRDPAAGPHRMAWTEQPELFGEGVA